MDLRRNAPEARRALLLARAFVRSTGSGGGCGWIRVRLGARELRLVACRAPVPAWRLQFVVHPHRHGGDACRGLGA